MTRWPPRTDLRSPYPPKLVAFRESDWPPVEGECLGRWACHGLGYEVECQPRLGSYCGGAFYVSAADGTHPDLRGCSPREVELIVARTRTEDAFTRWCEARAQWAEEHGLPRAFMESMGGYRSYAMEHGLPYFVVPRAGLGTAELAEARQRRNGEVRG